MTIVRTTVDDKIYDSAADILSTLGMDVNAAVRMFLQGVVLHNGIPFDLRLTAEQVQAMRLRRETNRQATLEAREIARGGEPGHASVETMLQALEKDETRWAARRGTSCAPSPTPKPSKKTTHAQPHPAPT